jgi:hypothetical protein
LERWFYGGQIRKSSLLLLVYRCLGVGDVSKSMADLLVPTAWKNKITYIH